jgi:hypothetical protein
MIGRNSARALRIRFIEFLRRGVSAEHGSPKTRYCMYPLRGSRMDNAENMLGGAKSGGNAPPLDFAHNLDAHLFACHRQRSRSPRDWAGACLTAPGIPQYNPSPLQEKNQCLWHRVRLLNGGPRCHPTFCSTYFRMVKAGLWGGEPSLTPTWPSGETKNLPTKSAFESLGSSLSRWRSA